MTAEGMKENITPEDIQKMIESSTGEGMGSGPWMALLMTILMAGPRSNGEADYWRGAYDALKELMKSEGK